LFFLERLSDDFFLRADNTETVEIDNIWRRIEDTTDNTLTITRWHHRNTHIYLRIMAFFSEAKFTILRDIMDIELEIWSVFHALDDEGMFFCLEVYQL
jgi:hypothetical protein